MSEAMPRRLRCAVYTRVSTDDGLDQEYNSIDAQRDAGHAYIASQRAEGWIPVADDYDDPAYSGGNMDRPGLKRLLVDIEAGRIDIVVVYKIDRLTRSLTDFSKMIELFERHGVSFVSVTQQFNTTNSMGRLMLNILLSFAQFEREVTGERIRDKIAASKKKGLWMGGIPPLGYDVKDRRLVINEREAKTVGPGAATSCRSAACSAQSAGSIGATMKKAARGRLFRCGGMRSDQAMPSFSLMIFTTSSLEVALISHSMPFFS